MDQESPSLTQDNKEILLCEDISIAELIVCQHSVRNLSIIPPLIRYVRGGGKFTNQPLIVVVKFDDNRLYLWDGHHRVVSIHLGTMIKKIHDRKATRSKISSIANISYRIKLRT
jgi:hypothetical protein